MTTVVSEQDIVNGIVLWFSPRLGYGYIDDGSEKQVFVHYKCLPGKANRNLETGDKVRFIKTYKDNDPNLPRVDQVISFTRGVK